jgi:transposase InsO family protein
VSGVRKGGDEKQVGLIRRIQEQYHYRYGSLREREAPRRDYGKRESRKKVARLMRENGLNTLGRRKFILTTGSNHGLEVCGNIPNRQFQAGRGGENWMPGISDGGP